MDEKNEITASMPEEEDWSDLFGVDYFADEDEDTPAEEDTHQDTEEATADEVTEQNPDAEGEASDPVEEEEEVTDAPEEQVEGEREEEKDEVDSAEEVEEEDSKPADDAAKILADLQAVDATIATFNDLEDVGLFALLLDQGKTPREALLESSPKLRSRMTEAKKSASKSHLRATSASAREDAIDMDAINAFRAVKPNVSEKEAIALYKRVRAR